MRNKLMSTFRFESNSDIFVLDSLDVHTKLEMF